MPQELYVQQYTQQRERGHFNQARKEAPAALRRAWGSVEGAMVEQTQDEGCMWR